MKQQNSLAEASEKKVLQALMSKSPMSWSELLAATQVSSRTLSKALNRLESKGLVYRKIEPTDKYPPPVLYGLTPQSVEVLEPILFGGLSFWWALGFNVEKSFYAETEEGFISGFYSENIRFLEALLRILARVFYGFIKYLETGNRDWYELTKYPLELNPIFLEYFGISTRWKMKIKEKPLRGVTIYEITAWEYKFSKSEFEELKKKCQKMFKKEWRKLEEIHANVLRNLELLKQKLEKQSMAGVKA
ncbi:MAG: winged helix-turn-helix transcriptional regulator [Candidatus Bathyarchaeia archaeon]